MENAIQQLADAVAELQGQIEALTTMVETVVITHPDPKKLQDHWNRLSAGRIAGTWTDVATKNRDADRAGAYHYQWWKKRLDLLQDGT